MPESEPVSLEFIADRIRHVIAEVASLRDDMNVLTSIVLRQDGTLTALLQEIRAVHSQIGRMNDRLRKVEETRG